MAKNTKKIPNKKTSTIEPNASTHAVTNTTNNIKAKIKSSKNSKFIPRLLCFSNIDANTICPYYFIQNILNQSYSSDYIFNIFVETKDIEQIYKKILKKYTNISTIRINFYLNEIFNINNHLIGFSNTEYQAYNTFLYMDSKAIYLSDYINSIISMYDYRYDITNIRFQYNLYNNLSYNYILNNKSLDILIKNKIYTTKNSWEKLLQEYKLKTKDILDTENSALSGIKKEIKNNDITSNDNNYKLIENEFFTICIFEHHFWSSYIYLNKRNKRMYNIFNDDHGAFEIQNDTIKIKWDAWGDETFYKKQLDDKTYYYSIDP
jgi:hypothetical protein